MLVTLDGMVMLVRAIQDANAKSPMLVTLEGMVTLISPMEALENAYVPILVTGRPLIVAGMLTAPP